MKIKFWTYIENLYDGSCAIRFFNSEEEAEAYAEKDDERFCDDINVKELEIDPVTLKLMKVNTRD